MGCKTNSPAFRWSPWQQVLTSRLGVSMCCWYKTAWSTLVIGCCTPVLGPPNEAWVITLAESLCVSPTVPGFPGDEWTFLLLCREFNTVDSSVWPDNDLLLPGKCWIDWWLVRNGARILYRVEDVDWTELAHVRVRWWDLVNTIMNLLVP
jgi:hypothetical protein